MPSAPQWGRVLQVTVLSVALIAAVLAVVVTVGTFDGEPAEQPLSPEATPTTSQKGAGSSDWPDAASTGSKGDLSAVRGGTVTVDGTVLEDVEVDGELVIDADHVTLRNVHVKSDDWFGVLVYGKHALIEDSTIQGAVGSQAGLAADRGGQFVARRVHVFNFVDGVRLTDDSVLRDSYIHDLVGTRGSHADAVTADGHTGWKILHNTILNQNGQTAAVWVGDPRFARSSGLLQDNYLAGGGYTLYGGPGTSPGIRVVDNVFSTRFFRRSGSWGPVANWDPAGNTWSGNKWADGPSSGRPVTP